MLKKIRKHNKWLMAGFGVLLMVTWLVQPAINQFNSAQRNRVVAKLDGQRINSGQWSDANSEVVAVMRLLPGLAGALDLNEQEKTVHWLMLCHEAEAAGLVGGPQDGEDWNAPYQSLVFSLCYRALGMSPDQLAQRYPQMAQQFLQQFDQQAKQTLPQIIRSVEIDQRMQPTQLHTALARARGIERLVSSYQRAARVSDRVAAAKAREYLDGAKADYVFVPAERIISTIPDPDASTLQAHFDKYKSTKPGEGEYGIGYLFPPRVKLEWMKLDRVAIEAAVSLDAVEVRKRYNQGHTGEPKKFPGEFAVERPNVEREMKTEVADKIVHEAQIAIQTEIIKATRGLEADGKYKKLPAGWEQSRPKFETIAQAVVDAVKKQTGTTIPLPAVTVKAADWLTRSDLQALPDIGRSLVRQGGGQLSFDQVVFWTREIPGTEAEAGPIPVQVNVPLAETYFTDFAQNRYYICVLATKGESPPDTIDEKREQIVKDYKNIVAFEQLKARADELKGKAITGGLDAIVAAFPAAEAPKPEIPAAAALPPPNEPKYKALEISKDVPVVPVNTADQHLGVEEVKKAVLAAAMKIDPLTPRELVAPDAATLAMPIAKQLGLVVVRIVTHDPVTKEFFRQVNTAVEQRVQSEELADLKAENPFSLANLLKRHAYTSGERDIKTIDDLKAKDDKKGG